ncbi:ATP-binding protein [Lentzea guizhouensis]|uniref:ATP-binding protein n=1 Tax=Lentzea guizhouensis TaxID=1586287 RepID=UPI0030033B0C
MGKTSLAVHWAHRVHDRFPDGQLYANLRGFSPEPPLPPAQVLTGFLTALGVSGTSVPQDLDAMAALYRSLLADRQVLVVLDNAATAEQVRPLLPGSARSLVLVTSRNRLPGLVARDGAHRITLGELPSGSALALLQDIVGVARIGAEHDAAHTLVHQCAGLPLALRIAAERIADRPHRTISDLTADLVARRLDTLASPDDNGTAVRTVFTWSYEALPLQAAKVFRRLSLHPGTTISTHAAAALTRTTAAEIRPVLDTLTGGHLLTEIGRDRFQFHDLVREYAAETARAQDSAEDRADCVRHLLGWYLHTADLARFAIYPQSGLTPFEHDNTGVDPLLFDDRDDALAWHSDEHTNLLSVLTYASNHGLHRIAALLPSCLAIPYALNGQWAAQVEIAAIALRSASQLNDENTYVLALTVCGEALMNANRLDEALQHVQEAFDLATRSQVPKDLAWAHHTIGLTLYKQGHTDRAADHFRAALALFQDLHIPRAEGAALGLLGEICRQQKKFEEAGSYLVRALEISHDMGSLWNQASVFHRLSQLSADLGALDEAVGHIQRSVQIYSNFRDFYGTARTLWMLGDLLDRKGDHGRAARVLAEALAIFDGIHAPEAEELRAVIAARPPAT